MFSNAPKPNKTASPITVLECESFNYGKLRKLVLIISLMNIEEICKKAEELAEKYNGSGVAPFPFENILADEKDLRIRYTDKLPENVSGVIIHDKTQQIFVILVDNKKPETRQYFTLAHELGHYYLHKEHLISNDIIVDDGDLGTSSMLYRIDTNTSTEMEREANNFAASLLMPKKLVRTAWEELKDIEELARIFKVSPSAMSIRLERLHLIQ